MWRILKILILLWPIPLMAYLIGTNIFQKASVDEKLFDVSDLVWGAAEKKVSVRVEPSFSGEQEIYEILLEGSNGQILSKYDFIIDKDMYGGGFIKAIQADNDQELELLVWGNHERETSFLLDYSEGQISKTNFKQLSEETKSITKQWYQAHISSGMSISLLKIFFIGYYIFMGIIWLIIKFIRYVRVKFIA